MTGRNALVSFAYNCGIGALTKSTVLRRLNRSDYDGAAKCAANSPSAPAE